MTKKTVRTRTRALLPICFIVLIAAARSPIFASAPTWKAGAAKAVITPKTPMWMAGYSSRTRPADGTLHELFVRALAVEDSTGRRAVIVSHDLLGISRSVEENICTALKEKHGLARSEVMLNSSHTHCGPVLRSALYDAYVLDETQKKRIEDYSRFLESTVVRTVGEALSHLVPAALSTGTSSADFAVNRRTNREPDVPMLIKKNALLGPTDHSVPVLAARTADGKLLAVVFGYACHNTTLGIYEWNGDYAGFAETNLETAHPGSVALFYMGCGADQNPLPRRTIELCRKYGHMMSDAVESVLKGRLEPLAPLLHTEYATVRIPLGSSPTRAELTSLASQSNSYITRWAKRLLKEMDAGRAFARDYPYPVQVWRLGKQLWIALGGEVVVDYSLRFKERYGRATWVSSYANDVMAYIPSRRVLHEGGYEGNTSMMVYGMPAERWGEDVEEVIASAVDRLVQH